MGSFHWHPGGLLMCAFYSLGIQELGRGVLNQSGSRRVHIMNGRMIKDEHDTIPFQLTYPPYVGSTTR